jgi:hypothetical protein
MTLLEAMLELAGLSALLVVFLLAALWLAGLLA